MIKDYPHRALSLQNRCLKPIKTTLRDVFDWHLRSKDFLSAIRLKINVRSDNLVHYFFNQSTGIMENTHLSAIIVGLRKNSYSPPRTH